MSIGTEIYKANNHKHNVTEYVPDYSFGEPCIKGHPGRYSNKTGECADCAEGVLTKKQFIQNRSQMIAIDKIHFEREMAKLISEEY